MADVSVTAANVSAAVSAVIGSATAGATITAGQSVYINTSDNKAYLADADTLAASAAAGIALNGASDGQPIDYIQVGNVDVGGTLTLGAVYVVSTTAGGIAPLADLGTGDYVTVLGVATATDNLLVNLIVSNTAEP
jgi:predicted transcriptional regulator|tara:strand:- start:5786 stop:6193 length:408 start_codon:yes stop_codon:yes gene_type:complete